LAAFRRPGRAQPADHEKLGLTGSIKGIEASPDCWEPAPGVSLQARLSSQSRAIKKDAENAEPQRAAEVAKNIWWFGCFREDLLGGQETRKGEGRKDP
jgi:hypothetical protein